LTDSPSDAPPEEAAATGDLGAFAAEIAAAVGADAYSSDFATVKVTLSPDRWVEGITLGRDVGLDFFSFLSAVDWSKEVAVGEPVADPESLVERFEILCRLSTVLDGRGVLFSTDISKDDPVIDSIAAVFPGANWHEREAHEMFGIEFRGHPQLVSLYLPDGFEGNPLRKSYPLLSREVKPWPGLVDVEDMPSTENPEAGGGTE